MVMELFTKKRNRAIRSILLLGICIALYMPGVWNFAAADTVVLKSGRQIEGRVQEDNDRFVQIQTATSGVITISKNRIQEVIKNEISEQESMADHAFLRGEYDKALNAYLELKRTDKGSEEIENKIEKVREAIRRKNTARFRESFEKADQFIKEEKLEPARELLRDVLKTAEPDTYTSHRARRALAISYFIENENHRVMVNYAGALDALEKAVDADPSFIMGHLELGRLYHTYSNNLENAIDAYQVGLGLGKEYLRSDPEDRQSFSDFTPVKAMFSPQKLGEYELEYAVLLYNSGRKQEASEHFQALLEEDLVIFSKPQRDEVIRYIGKILTDIDTTVDLDVQKALAGLDMALQYDPDLALAWFWKGYIYSRESESEKAIKAFTRAFELDNTMVEALKLRAREYLRINDIANARSDLEKLTGDPTVFNLLNTKERYDALVSLGTVFLEGLLYDPAMAAFNKAIEREKELIPAYLGRAKVNRRKAISPLVQENEIADLQEQAWQDIEKAQSKNSKLLEPVLLKGKLLKDQAEKHNDKELFAQAKDQFTRIIDELKERDAENLPVDKKEMLAEAYCETGEIQLLSNNRNLARAQYEYALEIRPDYARAYSLLGEEAQKRNDFELAQQHYNKAIELAPQNADFELNLAIMFHAQKDYPQAIAHYKKYQDKASTSADPRVSKWIQECREGIPREKKDI